MSLRQSTWCMSTQVYTSLTSINLHWGEVCVKVNPASAGEGKHWREAHDMQISCKHIQHVKSSCEILLLLKKKIKSSCLPVQRWPRAADMRFPYPSSLHSLHPSLCPSRSRPPHRCRSLAPEHETPSPQRPELLPPSPPSPAIKTEITFFHFLVWIQNFKMMDNKLKAW